MPTSTLSARRSRGVLLICLAGVLWGTGGLSAEIVRRYVDLSPLAVGAYRTGIAAVVLLAATVVTRSARATCGLAGRHPFRVVGIGLTTAAYQGLYFSSVALVGVTVSTVVSLGTAPVALAVADALRSRRLPSLRRTIVLAAALLGVVLLSCSTTGGDGSSGAATSSGAWWGVVSAVLSGAGFATATALGEAVAREESALSLTALTTCVAAACFLPLAVWGGGPWWTTNAIALTTLVYLGAATFALAYGLLFAGLRTATSSAAVLAALLEPVTAALLATVFLGERLTVVGAAGVVLTLGAIAVQMLGKKPHPADGWVAHEDQPGSRRERGEPACSPAV